MEGAPRIELSVRACRDCQHSVPGTNEDGEEDENFARCTHTSASLLGEPLYHLALAEAPLCSTMRESEVCGPDSKLFEPAA